MIFFNYLTDFSFFLLKKNLKVAGHGQKMSKMEVLKGGVDGFRNYFGWFTVISFSNQNHPCLLCCRCPQHTGTESTYSITSR